MSGAVLGRPKDLPPAARLGREGEEAAYWHLRGKGFIMVARNYRARGSHKEIDLIDSWDGWNAQANLLSAEDTWYVRAYNKNIADEDHLVGMYVTDPSSGMFTNVFAIEPRTYGLALGYNFN